jgi:hypothetical protein
MARLMGFCGGVDFVKCVVFFADRWWKRVRAWRECPPKLTPPAKLAGTPISDDETVAKMGHPNPNVGHPPRFGCNIPCAPHPDGVWS